MIDDSSTLPVAADAPAVFPPSPRVPKILEEEIWLSKQKRPAPRRAYRARLQSGEGGELLCHVLK
jgi:hypothetical protein